MTLLEEYKNQNIWRDWDKYIKKLPLNKNQTVYDLGCSTGVVSKLLSSQVKKVIGFDNDRCLLEEANKQKQNNCEFILEDIFTFIKNMMNYF
ncbi:class I SAM-dependent methyltransferase [Clostridium pasteurianum]|nr:methyltransferase domain-containing protein [Clostridium pasteurianum]